MYRLALATLFAAAFIPAAGAQQTPPQTWVAVADDGRDAFGYAVGMGTREAAEISSLGQCGGGCSLRFAAAARCVAFVRSDSGDASGYGAGVSRDAAQQSAWDACNRRVPANSCRVRAAQCFE